LVRKPPNGICPAAGIYSSSLPHGDRQWGIETVVDGGIHPKLSLIGF
jgi:hypothetical protein